MFNDWKRTLDLDCVKDFTCCNYGCKNYDNCTQAKNGDFVPQNLRLENKIEGKLLVPILKCDNYELPCYACQGGGCPACAGSGFIPQ